MNRRDFLYRIGVSGVIAGLFCGQSFGVGTGYSGLWRHTGSLHLTPNDRKIITACLSMGRCRILAGGAVSCLSGTSAFALPLCLINDDIETIGSEIKKIHGAKVTSNLLKGLNCLDVVFGNKHYPIVCLSQFDTKQADTTGNCYSHITLSVDPESNMVFDLKGFYKDNASQMPSLKMSEDCTFADILLGYEEMFVYGIRTSLDFEERKNSFLSNIRAVKPAQVVMGVLDSLIAIEGYYGEGFDDDFLFQPLVQHAFSTLLKFDKAKYMAVLPKFRSRFEKSCRQEILLASIFEASGTKDLVQSLSLLYLAHAKIPSFPVLFRNAAYILETYHKDASAQG